MTSSDCRGEPSSNFRYALICRESLSAEPVLEVKRNSTYGLVIDIKHTDRISTRYAHLSSALVTPGEKVLRGDLIGQVGSTGHSTGPHLHYEVILDGQQVNPQNYLTLTDRLAEMMQK